MKAESCRWIGSALKWQVPKPAGPEGERPHIHDAMLAKYCGEEVYA